MRLLLRMVCFYLSLQFCVLSSLSGDLLLITYYLQLPTVVFSFNYFFQYVKERLLRRCEYGDWSMETCISYLLSNISHLKQRGE